MIQWVCSEEEIFVIRQRYQQCNEEYIKLKEKVRFDWLIDW